MYTEIHSVIRLCEGGNFTYSFVHADTSMIHSISPHLYQLVLNFTFDQPACCANYQFRFRFEVRVNQNYRTWSWINSRKIIFYPVLHRIWINSEACIIWGGIKTVINTWLYFLMRITVDQMCIIISNILTTSGIHGPLGPRTGRFDLITDFQNFVFRSGPRFFLWPNRTAWSWTNRVWPLDLWLTLCWHIWRPLYIVNSVWVYSNILENILTRK